MRKRILLADDHNLVRSGLNAILSQDHRYEVVAEAVNGIEAIDKVATIPCDLVIADVAMPRLGGIEMIQALRARGSSVRILVLSMYDDAQFVVRAMKAGANGYLLKHAMDDELFLAIDTILSGGSYISELINVDAIRELSYAEDDLTPRELEVLHLIADGMSNPQIAELLAISPNTVTRHRANLMHKLHVHNRVELIHTAFSRGLITIAKNGAGTLDG